MKNRIALVLLMLTAWTSARADVFVVDGPANVRKTPKGEIIASLPDRSTVGNNTGETVQGEWIPIVFNPPTHGPVYYSMLSDDAKAGWIHASNLKKVSREQMFKIDPLQVYVEWSAIEGKSTHSAVLKKECSCGMIRSHYHDVPERKVSTLTQGFAVVGECRIVERGVVCDRPEAESETHTICLRECVDLKPLVKLTRESRFKLLSEAGAKFRVKITPLISKEMAQALTQKFPGWLPLVLPHPKRSTEYTFDLEGVESFIEFEFPFQGKTKKRKILIFFQDIESAFSQTPSIAFEGNEAATEFRKLPYSLKPTGDSGDEDRPSFCVGRSENFFVLNSCRQQNESSAFIARVDFRSDPVKSIAREEMDKALGLTQPDASWCCTPQGSKFQWFK